MPVKSKIRFNKLGIGQGVLSCKSTSPAPLAVAYQVYEPLIVGKIVEHVLSSAFKNRVSSI